MIRFDPILMIRFEAIVMIRFDPILMIRFEPTGCWSSVGMEKGEQVVNLQFPTCIGK